MIISKDWAFNGDEKFREQGKCCPTDNGMFEVNMLDINWYKYHTMICSSFDGLFIHKEIDG